LEEDKSQGDVMMMPDQIDGVREKGRLYAEKDWDNFGHRMMRRRQLV
jgi:hypothetical protein